MLTIKEFCNKHHACEKSKELAMNNCMDMQEAWLTSKPELVIWMCWQSGVLTDKELRLFAVFCARQVEHLITNERSKNAINVAEKFAYGNATNEELASASDAARASASDAARASARAAASDAAWDAAMATQSKWLKENTTPNFN